MRQTSISLLARCGLLLVLVALSSAQFLTAQTTWTGAVSSAWTDPQNWSNGVPNATTDAVIAPATNGCGGGGACLNLHVLPGAQMGGVTDLFGSAVVEADMGGLSVWTSGPNEVKSITCLNGARISGISSGPAAPGAYTSQLTMTDVRVVGGMNTFNSLDVHAIYVVGDFHVGVLFLNGMSGTLSADPAAVIRVGNLWTDWTSVILAADTEVGTVRVYTTSSVGSVSGQIVIKPGQQMTIDYNGGIIGNVVVQAGGTLHMNEASLGVQGTIGNVDCQGDLIMQRSGLTYFGDLMVSGTMRVNPPSSPAPPGQLVLGDIVIGPGGSFEVCDESTVSADSLMIAQGGDAIFASGFTWQDIVVAGDVSVDGLLQINSRRQLQKAGATPGTLTVGAQGTLELVGAPTPTFGPSESVEVDNFSLVIEGTIAASYAEFVNLGPDGLRLADTASIAPPPLDLSNCSLSSSQATPGAALLTVERLAPTAIRDLELNGPTSFGVRATAPHAVALVDATGNRSGEAWEDDPLGVITWSEGVGYAGGGTTYCSPLAICSANGEPSLGNSTFALGCSPVPSSGLCLFALGSPSSTGFAVLGVHVWLDPLQLIVLEAMFASPQGHVIAPLPIPSIPGLLGYTQTGQFLILEPASCGLSSFAMSTAITLTITQ